MKKIIISCGILILFLVIGGVAYNCYTRTPIYSLKQAGKAILGNDQMSLEKYIDLDSIVSHIIDEKLSTDPEILDNPFTLGVAALMKPQLVALTKQGMLNGFQGIRERAKKENGKLRYIKDIKILQNDGKIATVEIVVYGKNNTNFNIKIGMHKIGGYWRVTQWFNANEMEKFAEQNP